MTLLVDDSGGNMTGGSETFGRAFAWVSRSWTICRAAMRSVPGSKVRRIDDSPSIDLGLDGLKPWHAVEEVRLQPNGEHSLDLLGRQAEGLGLDLDVGCGEFGKGVYGDVPKCQDSKEENQAGDAQDQ